MVAKNLNGVLCKCIIAFDFLLSELSKNKKWEYTHIQYVSIYINK